MKAFHGSNTCAQSRARTSAELRAAHSYAHDEGEQVDEAARVLGCALVLLPCHDARRHMYGQAHLIVVLVQPQVPL